MANKPGNMRASGEARTASNDATDPSSNPPPASKPTSASHDATPSLVNRVQNSAAGLVRSAFQGAGSSDPARALINATNGKAAGSPASSSTAVSPDVGHDLSALGRGSAAGQEKSGSAIAKSFRSGDIASSTQGGFTLPPLTEDEFQRGHTHIEGGSSEAGFGLNYGSHGSLEEETGNWKGKQRAYDPAEAEYNAAWERTQTAPSIDTQKPHLQPTDGAAVVSLLSDTSFDPNFDPSTENLDLDPASSPPPLSAAEITMLDSYRREIRIESHSHQEQQLSSLSLVPDIDTFLQQNDPGAFISVDRNTSPANITLRDSVLTHLPGAADWVDVQDRYHNEVWGYLRPALEAAKEELEEKQDGSEHEGEDGPAVRRLKMILKHMKT